MKMSCSNNTFVLFRSIGRYWGRIHKMGKSWICFPNSLNKIRRFDTDNANLSPTKQPFMIYVHILFPKTFFLFIIKSSPLKILTYPRLYPRLMISEVRGCIVSNFYVVQPTFSLKLRTKSVTSVFSKFQVKKF